MPDHCDQGHLDIILGVSIDSQTIWSKKFSSQIKVNKFIYDQ